MRLRNNPKANDILAAHDDIVILDGKQYRGKWNELFGNSNPIYIEIGMGKGDFIIENALRYPNINYIGIEKFPSVMVGAIKKIDQLEKIPSNLKLLKEDAILLTEVFGKHEVNRIHLNFSDPWPKKKKKKRRLTSPAFLDVYQNILIDNGELILKTDNRLLFEYSLVSFQNYGLHFEDVCLDLHHSEGYEDNIQTEYERKFSPFGPIYQVKTTFKGVNKNG